MGWTKAPPDEKFWTVISKTYEVTEDAADHDDNGTGNDNERPNAKGDDDNVMAVDATATATATDSVGLSTTNLKGNDKHGEEPAAEGKQRHIARGDLEQGAFVDGTEDSSSSSAPSIWSRIFPRALIRWVSPSSSASSQRDIGQSTDTNNRSTRRNKRKPQIEANRCRLVSEDNTTSTCGITTCSLASSPGTERSQAISSKDYDKPNKDIITEIHLVSLQRIEEGAGNNVKGSRDTDENESST